MTKKRRKSDNIYIPKGTHYQEEGFGNPGKPNYKLRSTIGFYNPEYDQFLRRQQQLKTRKK